MPILRLKFTVIFPSSTHGRESCRPALGPTQASIQGVPRFFFSKVAGYEVYHSPSSSNKIKNE